jgi:DNA-binding transcriptional MerR regulator
MLMNTLATCQLGSAADAHCGGDFYSIGDLAKLLGIEATAIRFYERRGLLKPGRLGKLRVYRKADADRAATIVFLRSTGMSLAKVEEVLLTADRQGNQSAANPLAQMLTDQLALMRGEAEKMTKKIAELSRAIDNV